jgi:hypothetical protein
MSAHHAARERFGLIAGTVIMAAMSTALLVGGMAVVIWLSVGLGTFDTLSGLLGYLVGFGAAIIADVPAVVGQSIAQWIGDPQ